jgi:hypothetical protein
MLRTLQFVEIIVLYYINKKEQQSATIYKSTIQHIYTCQWLVEALINNNI